MDIQHDEGSRWNSIHGGTRPQANQSGIRRERQAQRRHAHLTAIHDDFVASLQRVDDDRNRRRRRLRWAGKLDLPFHVNGFLAAVAGAAIVAVVSWGLSLLLRDPKLTRHARP